MQTIVSLLANHVSWVLWMFGGIAGVAGLAIKGFKPAVAWAIQAAIDNPKLHPILIELRPQIEDFFAFVDKTAKEKLDAAK